MDPNNYEIYLELRKTKQELVGRLQNEESSPLVRPYIEGELHDIETALLKLEKGTFGTCEISGELLPAEVLSMIPTLQSMDDCKKVSYFFRKS